MEFFKGKVLVPGVCMELECIVDVFGEEIILHDSRGCFNGIAQGIKSTRYHSLSAAHITLPMELVITAPTDDSGIIMGMRHQKYTLEAVQYHPKSILSKGSNTLIRNFLMLRRGMWEENPASWTRHSH
ncbi:hypothetical protein EDD18DRAFT_1198958 [Armillaria luteobubalina]|uniref:anthranilate synthase n=1 Tax=Armillaria luteobubalina TaxID=153913 RepID=A0AA39PI43_9AGAR|nr:hypothetical protein EDD18DRAFT_1198958 [Armillaria luteobubalina]